MVASPIAAGHSCLSAEERELGVALVEFGAQVTNVSVYAAGMLVGLVAIPMGSGDITAMHKMMHTMMRGSVPEEVLAACNEAHANMTTGSVNTTGTGSVDHTAHHMGSGS